jgi:hypothetical protein
MGKRRRRTKNAGRISIDTKTHIGTKKEQTRNDGGNRKWIRKRITKTTNENWN